MADPFATALAALHLSAGSVAATFTPKGGAPTGIRVIRGQPSEQVAYGAGSVVLDTNAVQIMRSDVADPTGGMIQIGSEIFAVQGGPTLDVEGITWTCQLEPV
jgi:hypothetical protein